MSFTKHLLFHHRFSLNDKNTINDGPKEVSTCNGVKQNRWWDGNWSNDTLTMERPFFIFIVYEDVNWNKNFVLLVSYW